MACRSLKRIGKIKLMFFDMFSTRATEPVAGLCRFTADEQAHRYLTYWNYIRRRAHRYFTGSLEPYVNWIGLLLWDVGLASAP